LELRDDSDDDVDEAGALGGSVDSGSVNVGLPARCPDCTARRRLAEDTEAEAKAKIEEEEEVEEAGIEDDDDKTADGTSWLRSKRAAAVPVS
jgi:hypothetical protein